MKKILSILSLVFLVFILSACVDRAKLYGTFEQIQIFDSSDQEVVGEYLDSYRNQNDIFKDLSLNYQQEINSPAPRKFYYCVPVVDGEEYILKITIVAKSIYYFSSIETSIGTFDLEDYQHSIEGKRVSIFIPITIDLENPYIDFYETYFAREDDGEEKIFKGGKKIKIEEESLTLYGVYFYSKVNISA